MGNNINFDREKYKRAFQFLEQRIRSKRDSADQYLKKWEQDLQNSRQELKRLEGEEAEIKERQGQVPQMAQLLKIGGKGFNQEEASAAFAGEIKENRDHAAACKGKIKSLEADGKKGASEQFIKDADFLRAQKEQFLSGKLATLPDWPYQQKDSILLQVEYVLLNLAVSKAPLSSMCDLLWRYVSGQEFKALPMTDEKGAFCGACAYQFFRRALAMYCSNQEMDDVESAIERIRQTFKGMKAGISPYPAVEQYRLLFENFGSEKAGIEEISVLGMRYDCYPDGTGRCKTGERVIDIHLEAWYSCFEKAMEDPAYHKIMQESIKAGFCEFLVVYDRQGEKCLKNVFGKWKNREQFADYVASFKEEVTRYLQWEAINGAVDIMYKKLEERGVPQSFSPSCLNSNKPGSTSKSYDEYRHLCFRYGAAVQDRWMTENLSLQYWRGDLLEEQLYGMACDRLLGDMRGRNLRDHIYFFDMAWQLDIYFWGMTRGKTNSELDGLIRGFLLPEAMKGFDSREQVGRSFSLSPSLIDVFKVLARYSNDPWFAPYKQIMKEHADPVFAKKFNHYMKLLIDGANDRRDDRAWKEYEKDRKAMPAEEWKAGWSGNASSRKGDTDKPQKAAVGDGVRFLMLFAAMIAATFRIYLFLPAWLFLLFATKKFKGDWRTVIQIILVFLGSAVAYYLTGGYSVLPGSISGEIIVLGWFSVPLILWGLRGMED